VNGAEGAGDTGGTRKPDTDDVRRFYDNNTRLMLRLGHTSQGTIHRAVWGPGVTQRAAALHYVDQLILERIPEHEPRVLDLGCGVASSLCRMAQQRPILGVGITISKAQAQLGQQRIQALGLAHRLRGIQGDLCNLPEELELTDLAFSIEAFVHATDAARFFQQAAHHIKPGGKLIICDDFVADERLFRDALAKRWLERFRKGWVIHSLLSATRADALARAAGFRRLESLDLGAYLELGRPRDRAMALLMRAFGWLPVKGQYWSMLYGGHALQVCLRRGWLEHRFVTWERLESPVADSDVASRPR
jgi:cyclopropane fatty-acyl-phospholipid synthase-like methyltransferase